MKSEVSAPAALGLPAEQIEFTLARIEHSAAFCNSPRHRALLRHLVTRLLAGDLASLKETVIAVEVFGRPAARFDPRSDTIVRVEARRLRARLARYDREEEGREAPLRIELPVGSYVPLITSRPPATPNAAYPPGISRHTRDLVERGEHFLRQALSKDSLEQARSRFEEALRESPGHIAALVGLGRAWFNLAVGWQHAPAMAAAHAAAALRQALQLEPDQPVALVLIAAIQHQFEHRWPAAERSFQRALALAPAHAFVHSAYGCHLAMRGAFDAAEQALLRARTLDPHYLNTRMHLANLRIAQRRLDEPRPKSWRCRTSRRRPWPSSACGVRLRCFVAMPTRPSATSSASALWRPGTRPASLCWQVRWRWPGAAMRRMGCWPRLCAALPATRSHRMCCDLRNPARPPRCGVCSAATGAA